MYGTLIPILLTLAAMIAGCSPSVRYTRERSSQPPPQEQGGDGSAWGADEYADGRIVPPAKATAQEPPPADGKRKRKAAKKTPDLLEQVANTYLGTPYKYGGTTRRGMDCSGFVTVVFREVYNKQLPRSSGQMWKEGIAVAITAARPGDLVFFKTKGRIDHVGIYMGNNRFIHSTTSKGVIYSDMKDPYYSKHFAGVKRVM